MTPKIDQLTATEFQTHIDHKTFRLAFVGMSNGGKSHRSRTLKQEAGFHWYEVDREIQKKLGFEEMESIANWMGSPDSEGYADREKIYMMHEEACTHLHHFDTAGKNLVFDTTGSVIYLSNEAKSWLHDQCLVVHIDVGEDSIPGMLQKYLEEPKPVSWNGMLQAQKNETKTETIARCYPLLLKNRLKQYRDFAHLSIPAEALHDKTGPETLAIIKNYLT